jgi:hypothetical protein
VAEAPDVAHGFDLAAVSHAGGLLNAGLVMPVEGAGAEGGDQMPSVLSWASG